MADATTPNNQVGSQDPAGFSAEISDAITLYAGRFVGMRGPDHGTTQGYLDHYTQEDGMAFLGLLESAGGLSEFLGATSASPVPEAAVLILPRILRRVTVAGVASRASIWEPVYVTDNQTMTLTRQTGGTPNGVVVEWHSSTTCDVLLFGTAIQAAIDLGSETELIYLGSIDFAEAADANLKTGIPMPYHGKILSVFTITELALTGAGGTTLLNLELGGTDVTGGVVTVATATQATLGTKSAGTAITAENVFHEGDLLDVEGASTGGTRTTGRVGLYITVAKKLGS